MKAKLELLIALSLLILGLSTHAPVFSLAGVILYVRINHASN